MKTLVPAALLILSGCVASPQHEDVQSIEKLAAGLSGKDLRLQFPLSADAPMLDGAKDATFGYAGLKEVYAPVYAQCASLGAAVRIAEQRVFAKGGAALPSRFQCRADDRILWELAVQYAEKTILSEKSGRTISLTPQASLVNASDTANQRIGREAPPGVEPRPKEKAKPRTDLAQKAVPQPRQSMSTGEQLRQFRKNLQAGDRVQWKTGAASARGVGRIVRLDGDLALVQFENQAITGQSVRYFNRSQLEPFNGVMPVGVAR